MKCEFSERMYEQCLNFELVFDRRFYTPTQNTEGIMAIDVAIFTNNPIFLGLWPGAFPSYPIGVLLNPTLWENDNGLDSIQFPNFKYNLFIQHKRPEFISSRRGCEYRFWNEPYFRYELDEVQQETLSELESKVQNDALVVYACPAF